MEDCGISFPQPVQSTTAYGTVFHEILHKLSLSTPQSFPFSTQKKFLHFSGFFPRMPCGENVPGISGKKPGFHFSGASTSTTISFLSFYSFFLQLRCFFSLIRRCLPEAYSSKLFPQDGHICKKHRNCVRFPVFPGRTRRQQHPRQKESGRIRFCFSELPENQTAE